MPEALDEVSSPNFLATLVRGLRYDLGGRIFEAGIARPCSSDDRDYLERHAIIAAETPGGAPMCMFDFVEDTTPARSQELFPLRRVAARNARLGDYTTPAQVDAARIISLPQK